MEVDTEKKHRHHKKHKHKKHKKHRRLKEINEPDEASTEQEIELDQTEYNMDIIGEAVTIPHDEQQFLMDAEHCEGALEVIEEQLIEIDDGIGTINIEEMVLENYGQEYEEVEVDVGGVEDAEELLEEFDEELIEHEEVEESEYEDQVIDSPDKIKSNKEAAKGKSRSKEKKTDGDVSSEEEAWLNALESGKLEEVDEELKKIRNPKLMTVRQRALLERKGELNNEENFKEELVALPTGYKETPMTEELLQKKALKSQRRREVAAQKREKEKKRTIDRLLLKRESKNNKVGSGNTNASTNNTTTVSYSYFSWKQTADQECYFSIPVNVESPYTAQVTRKLPEAVYCGVKGCTNPKRYSCSKTALPLCSLKCYRINLQMSVAWYVLFDYKEINDETLISTEDKKNARVYLTSLLFFATAISFSLFSNNQTDRKFQKIFKNGHITWINQFFFSSFQL